MTDIELVISTENEQVEMKITGVSLKGDPGYTPQKGVDYWTEEERAAICTEAAETVREDIADELDGKANKDEVEDCFYNVTQTDWYSTLDDNKTPALLFEKKNGEMKEIKLFTVTRTLENSDNLVTSGAVYDAIEKVSAIAKGRATGYVFDTKEDMDEWLGVEENKAALKLGDNLYIRDVGVPDYWWDEQTQTAQILETQKVELTEYAKKADTVVEVVAISNKASSDVHYYYINYKDGKGEYSSTRLFNADNSQPTEGSDNLITSGAVYNAMGNIENALDGIIAIQNTLMGGESE